MSSFVCIPLVESKNGRLEIYLEKWYDMTSLIWFLIFKILSLDKVLGVALLLIYIVTSDSCYLNSLKLSFHIFEISIIISTLFWTLETREIKCLTSCLTQSRCSGNRSYNHFLQSEDQSRITFVLAFFFFLMSKQNLCYSKFLFWKGEFYQSNMNTEANSPGKRVGQYYSKQ